MREAPEVSLVRTLFPTVLLAVPTLVACGSDVDLGSGVVVRDSAGITIVESHEPQWSAGEQWLVSEQPLATIGMDEGPEEYTLHEVRGALRFPDGRIVIANNGTDQLRFYDASGEFLHSVGQDGYGPGEFKMMWGMWSVRDSLVIDDFGQDRVSVFSADGEYGRTMMLDREPGAFMPKSTGVFADGSILGFEFVMGDRGGGDTEGMRFRRVEAVYRRYMPDGAVSDSVGVLFWAELLSEMQNSRTDEKTGVKYGSGVSASAPFGRSASTRAHGEHIYHAHSDSYEIQVFSRTGTLERLIRRPIPNPPVSENDKDLFREDFIGDDPRFETWARRRVAELVFPETKPAYGTMRVDELGNIWVAEYSTGREDLSGVWTVFDSEGRMLGEVRVPVGGKIAGFGNDYLIGVWRTELDVEQVRMYGITKGDVGTSR